MPEKKPQNAWEQVGRYSSLAFLFPAATFAGYACGYLLDRWLGTKFFTVVCLLLGIAGGFCPVLPTGTKRGQT